MTSLFFWILPWRISAIFDKGSRVHQRLVEPKYPIPFSSCCFQAFPQKITVNWAQVPKMGWETKVNESNPGVFGPQSASKKNHQRLNHKKQRPPAGRSQRHSSCRSRVLNPHNHRWICTRKHQWAAVAKVSGYSHRALRPAVKANGEVGPTAISPRSGSTRGFGSTCFRFPIGFC